MSKRKIQSKLDAVTQDRLHCTFFYNDETGELVWGVQKSGSGKIFQTAGFKNRFGYWIITLDREKWHRSHLVWLFHKGEWPTNFLDHINQDRSDDRIENLREATKAQNARNSKLRTNNSTGFKGVYREGNRWRGQIRFNGKLVSCGTWETPEIAAGAVDAKKTELDGEFYAKT